MYKIFSRFTILIENPLNKKKVCEIYSVFSFYKYFDSNQYTVIFILFLKYFSDA